MSDDGQELETNNDLPFYGDHRFLVLIISAIFISGILIIISMFLYYKSDAAQLDLSRPGYKDVRSQAVSNDSSFSNYSNYGDINKDTIAEFKALFNQQAIKAKGVDAFGGDPLNPDKLWVND